METQTRSSHHYKFILAKNITILSVSSDDFLHAFLEVEEQQIHLQSHTHICINICIYIYMCEIVSE